MMGDDDKKAASGNFTNTQFFWGRSRETTVDKNMRINMQFKILLLFTFSLVLTITTLTSVFASSECLSVKLIYNNADTCDGQKVTIAGKASGLKLQTSGKGNRYTTFLLNDGTAKPIKIYSPNHLTNITDGNTVQVTGTFNKVVVRKDFEFPMQILTTPNGVTLVETVVRPEPRAEVPKPTERATERAVAPAPQKSEKVMPKVETRRETSKQESESKPTERATERAVAPAPQKSEEFMPKAETRRETSKQESEPTNILLITIIAGIIVIVIAGVVVVMLKRGKGQSQPAAQRSGVYVTEKSSPPQSSAVTEQVKPSVLHDVGEAFENYVLSRFDMRDWVVVDRTKDFSGQLGRNVESDSNPDLVFRHKDTGKVVAVECKYRSRFAVTDKGDEYIQWASEFNIKNYNAYRERTRNRVFIAVGIGGKPPSPGRLFVVPLSALQKIKVSENYLNKFERNPEYKFMIEEFKKIDKGL